MRLHTHHDETAKSDTIIAQEGSLLEATGTVFGAGGVTYITVEAASGRGYFPLTTAPGHGSKQLFIKHDAGCAAAAVSPAVAPTTVTVSRTWDCRELTEDRAMVSLRPNRAL